MRALVGDFGGVGAWIPFALRCEIEDDAADAMLALIEGSWTTAIEAVKTRLEAP